MPLCVHLLHRRQSMSHKYGFVLYWDINLYSLWGIGRNVVILQKGFAVHQLWHFDLFCTKHFEIQSNEGFVWVRNKIACLLRPDGIKLLYNLIGIWNRHNFTCSAVKIRRSSCCVMLCHAILLRYVVILMLCYFMLSCFVVMLCYVMFTYAVLC